MEWWNDGGIAEQSLSRMLSLAGFLTFFQYSTLPSFLFLWRHSQVARQRSAKPLFTSSNLVAASNDLPPRLHKDQARQNASYRHHVDQSGLLLHIPQREAVQKKYLTPLSRLDRRTH
jgi:hypothetical protein